MNIKHKTIFISMSALQLTQSEENKLCEWIHFTHEKEERMSPETLRKSLYQLGAMLYRSYFDLPLPVDWAYAGVSHPTLIQAMKKNQDLMKKVSL